MRSYLGFTCHYTEDTQLRSGMLACKRFRGRHTAENFQEEYENIIETFELHRKVSAAISDNVSNMVKALALPGTEIFQLEEDSEEHDDEVMKTLSILSVERDSAVFGFISGNSGCFCHTIQLIIKDALKEAAAINKVIDEECTPFNNRSWWMTICLEASVDLVNNRMDHLMKENVRAFVELKISVRYSEPAKGFTELGNGITSFNLLTRNGKCDKKVAIEQLNKVMTVTHCLASEMNNAN